MPSLAFLTRLVPDYSGLKLTPQNAPENQHLIALYLLRNGPNSQDNCLAMQWHYSIYKMRFWALSRVFR